MASYKDRVKTSNGISAHSIMDRMRGEGKTGLTLQDDGSYLDEETGIRLDKLGAHVPAHVDPDAFVEFGRALLLFNAKVQMWVGDYLLSCERLYGETYQELAVHLKLDPKTLYQYVWVCGNVPISLRRENLTYSHYQLVAGLDTIAQRRQWLDMASDGGWSVAKLRQEMADKPPTLPTGNPLIDPIHKRRFNKIWRFLQNGVGDIDEDDLNYLDEWFTAVKKRFRNNQRP